MGGVSIFSSASDSLPFSVFLSEESLRAENQLTFFRFVSKMRDELFKRERRSFLSVWKITILFTPSHGISKTWDIILPLKSFSYKTPTYRGIISRKYFLRYINLTNCPFFATTS